MIYVQCRILILKISKQLLIMLRNIERYDLLCHPYQNIVIAYITAYTMAYYSTYIPKYIIVSMYHSECIIYIILYYITDKHY